MRWLAGGVAEASFNYHQACQHSSGSEELTSQLIKRELLARLLEAVEQLYGSERATQETGSPWRRKEGQYRLAGAAYVWNRGNGRLARRSRGFAKAGRFCVGHS